MMVVMHDSPRPSLSPTHGHRHHHTMNLGLSTGPAARGQGETSRRGRAHTHTHRGKRGRWGRDGPWLACLLFPPRMLGGGKDKDEGRNGRDGVWATRGEEGEGASDARVVKACTGKEEEGRRVRCGQGVVRMKDDEEERSIDKLNLQLELEKRTNMLSCVHSPHLSTPQKPQAHPMPGNAVPPLPPWLPLSFLRSTRQGTSSTHLSLGQTERRTLAMNQGEAATGSAKSMAGMPER